MVGDCLVGLIPHLDRVDPMLSVYVEMGETCLDVDASLYARLLETNLHAPDPIPGRWGLHPQSRQAVYCMSFGLYELDGAQLAHLLKSRIALARQVLEPIAQVDRQVVSRLVDIDQLIEAEAPVG